MNKHEIKSLINKKNPLVLDIGCYDGKDSKELSDILDCCVHCFEPDPLSQAVFKTSHKKPASRLILYECAIGNINGKIPFYQSNHPQSNSIHTPKLHTSIFPEVEFDETIEVYSSTLDSWYELYRYGWKVIFPGQMPVIDFIWADVNGAERELILGGRYALKNTRYLYIEVANKELYAGQRTWHYIKELLPNFEIQKAYNWGNNFGNILFKNMKL